MEDLNFRVLQGFGVKAKKIIKEKSYYICNTDKGHRVIRKSLDSAQHIVFQHEIKEQLFQRGFTNTDRYKTSVWGHPYFESEGSIYVMTDLANFTEINFSDGKQMLQAVATLAQFHKLANHITVRGTYFYCDDRNIEEYNKSTDELNSIRKSLVNQRRLSDFDVLFLKNYKEYQDYIKQATDSLQQTKFRELKKKASENLTICHNRLKEENFLFSGSDLFLTGFSNAGIDLQLFDLCAIIQRYTKYLPEVSLSIGRLLDEYCKYINLTSEHFRIIHGILLYPSQFIKLCKQYYSKKRHFIPTALINRLNTLLVNAKGYENFINPLLKY